MKRTCLITAIILCLLVLIIPKPADAATTASGQCGSGVVWSLDSNGTLTVSRSGSGTGTMTDFTHAVPGWQPYQEQVKKIVVKSGIREVSPHAFDTCKNVTSVVLEGVTTIGMGSFGSLWNLTDISWGPVERIEHGAFGGCEGLKTVSLPDSVTYIGSYAFGDCSMLEQFTARNVTVVEEKTFQGCASLVSVSMNRVTKVGKDAFRDCRNLQTLDMPQLTQIGEYAFYSTGSFTLNADQVTSLGQYAFCYSRVKEASFASLTTVPSYAFHHASALRSLSIPNVTTIEAYAFDTCGIEEFTAEKAVTVGLEAFADCPNLTTVNLPAVKEIQKQAFGSCKALTTVSFPQVQTIREYAFAWCPALQNMELPNTLTTMEEGCFRQTGVTSVTIPASVTNPETGIFTTCPNLTEVVVEGAGSVGNNMFINCTALTSVTMEHVTVIGNGAFSGCKALTEVEMPAATQIGSNAFYNCTSLNRVDAPCATEIGKATFQGCLYLKEVNLPKVETVLELAFYQCKRLEQLDLPCVKTLGRSVFAQCEKLCSVSLPSLTSMGNSVFNECAALEEVVLGPIGELSAYAFIGCTSLEQVTIPPSVRLIGESAFSGCTALTSVVIPSAVQWLNDGAFWGCTGLTEVWFRGSAPVFQEDDAYGPSVFRNVTATVYYPSEDPTWTEEVRQNHGGTLTWVPHTHTYSDWKCTGCGREGPINGTLGDGITWVLQEHTGILTVSGNGAMPNFNAEPTSQPWHGIRSSVTAVVIEEGITAVGDYAFAGMPKVQRAALPESLTTIGANAFSGTAVTELILPESVSSVGSGAMADCTKLKSIFFQGDAPAIGEDTFRNVVAEAYYPQEKAGWDGVITSGYGGTLTWKLYDPRAWFAEVTRIAGADRIETSLMLADRLKTELDVQRFDSIVVASALNFPDALTGSYLAAVKNAPILLTYSDVRNKIIAYIEENLAPGGTVYVLGGESAVDVSFTSRLNTKGINNVRVAGSDRFGTNLAIMQEAGVSADQPVLIATAVNFADSLSASAAGLPMVLVYGSLRPDQKEFLYTTSRNFIIIGGTSAVSEELEAELRGIGSVERLAGSGRYETSVMVAQKFVSDPDAVVLAYARNFPDGLCGGPLAYALGAPLILTDNFGPGEADGYVDGIYNGIVVGGAGLISDETVKDIFDLPDKE